MDEDTDLGGGGLGYGITTFHLRLLTDNAFEGGGGLSYQEVAEMTPDQVCHRLCDRSVLKARGGRRISKTTSSAVVTDNGRVKGRAADGTPIEGAVRVDGKSLARRLMEAEQLKRETAAQQPRRRKRG